MSAVTPWFNLQRDGVPVRRGWYEVAYSAGMRLDAKPLRKYFNGKVWLHGARMAKCGFGNMTEDFHREYWRGLATKPAKTEAA